MYHDFSIQFNGHMHVNAFEHGLKAAHEARMPVSHIDHINETTEAGREMKKAATQNVLGVVRPE